MGYDKIQMSIFWIVRRLAKKKYPSVYNRPNTLQTIQNENILVIEFSCWTDHNKDLEALFLSSLARNGTIQLCSFRNGQASEK
jgi:hypothetical protein